jgi:hypothetical protein
MTLSRRSFVADASYLGLLTALMPELAAAQAATSQAAADDTPHDSYDFWNGFFDSVNPLSKNYGQKSATRGPADQLARSCRRDPIPALQIGRQDSSVCDRHFKRRVAWTTMATWL